MARGAPWRYDRRCLNLTDEQKRANEGRPGALRFLRPDRPVVVDDVIRGESTFPASDIDDFIILRSSGMPTYLLAAAVDDWKMELTHVIRGEDLHSSTPRQILLLEALGAERVPHYAHLPLIVGPDRKPLSKRHGSVAVERFREEGFLADAMVNYLALLGWSLDDHTTFLSRDELVKHFDLDRVSRNPAAFDREKLEWLNGHYLREMPAEEFAGLAQEKLAEAGIAADPQMVANAAPLIQERMKLLAEVPALLRFLFEDVAPDQKARKMLDGQAAYLEEVANRLEALEQWTHEAIEAAMRSIQEERELGARKAFQPVRAAVTGTLVSPPLFESMELLGRDRTLARIRAAALS